MYAQRFDTVELNTTGYRLPAEDQFARWGEQTPSGFTFAVKMPLTRLDRVGTFVERVAVLGERLGPIRITVQSARDDGMLAFLRGSLDMWLEASPAKPPTHGRNTGSASARRGLPVAFDFRHDSWDGVGGVVRVNDFDAEPFRYIRLREPPYDDSDLRDLAARLRPPAWVFFRHEDEPTAPVYAARLRELLDA